MTQRKPAIATRVSPRVNKAVKQLTKTLGITVSEYLRKLILDDLESKRILNSQFATTLEQDETMKPERPEEMIRKALLEPDGKDDDESFW